MSKPKAAITSPAVEIGADADSPQRWTAKRKAATAGKSATTPSRPSTKPPWPVCCDAPPNWRCLAQTKPPSTTPYAAEHYAAEIAKLDANPPSTTEALALVKQRRGQDLFRAALMDYWGGPAPLLALLFQSFYVQATLSRGPNATLTRSGSMSSTPSS